MRYNPAPRTDTYELTVTTEDRAHRVSIDTVAYTYSFEETSTDPAHAAELAIKRHYGAEPDGKLVQVWRWATNSIAFRYTVTR